MKWNQLIDWTRFNTKSKQYLARAQHSKHNGSCSTLAVSCSFVRSHLLPLPCGKTFLFINKQILSSLPLKVEIVNDRRTAFCIITRNALFYICAADEDEAYTQCQPKTNNVQCKCESDTEDHQHMYSSTTRLSSHHSHFVSTEEMEYSLSENKTSSTHSDCFHRTSSSSSMMYYSRCRDVIFVLHPRSPNSKGKFHLFSLPFRRLLTTFRCLLCVPSSHIWFDFW